MNLMQTTPKRANEKKAFKPLHDILREKDEIMPIAQVNVDTAGLDHPSVKS